MNELALFAGCGGGLLAGYLLGWRTIAAVELDEYCRKILLQRQDEGCLHPFPIWDDIRTFDGRPFRGCVDLITAGFPCQPFSAAGHQLCNDDSRNLWPETSRIVQEVKPNFIFLENVPKLLSSGYFAQVAGDLAASGYCYKWRVLSAAELGAPHLRDRIWIVAYSSSLRGTPSGRKITIQPTHSRPSCAAWWYSAPGIPRVDDGVANRMDRIRAIGNGQVPGVARLAWSLLNG